MNQFGQHRRWFNSVFPRGVWGECGCRFNLLVQRPPEDVVVCGCWLLREKRWAIGLITVLVGIVILDPSSQQRVFLERIIFFSDFPSLAEVGFWEGYNYVNQDPRED